MKSKTFRTFEEFQQHYFPRELERKIDNSKNPFWLDNLYDELYNPELIRKQEEACRRIKEQILENPIAVEYH